MREIIIISGKGGTGKTSLTGAFVHLAGDKIICDLDVDARDLHLLLQPARERVEEFYSGNEAEIDGEQCDGCGLCATLCQFGAIRENGAGFAVDPVRCEGCKVCVAFCRRRPSGSLRDTAANGTSQPLVLAPWSMPSSFRAPRTPGGWLWSLSNRLENWPKLWG